MTNAEHLIENAIFNLKKCKSFDNDYEDINADHTSCTIPEVLDMAQHIVYSLYDGIFPDEIDNYEKVVRCKDCIYFNKKSYQCSTIKQTVPTYFYCAAGHNKKDN